jgi:hypothetical protein
MRTTRVRESGKAPSYWNAFYPFAFHSQQLIVPGFEAGYQASTFARGTEVLCAITLCQGNIHAIFGFSIFLGI